MTDPGIRITVTDLKTGEEETATITDDFVVICAGRHYVASRQVSLTSGTQTITIKRRGES